MGRLAVISIAFAFALGACGDDDDTDVEVTDEVDGTDALDDAPATPATPASAAESVGDQDEDDEDDGTDGSALGTAGGAEYRIEGGDLDVEGTLGFVAEASVYQDGAWALSFASDDGQAVLTINLLPDGLNVNYGDLDMALTGIDDQCEFDVDEQSDAGASGRVECDDLAAITPGGVVNGVDLRVDFDANA